MATELTPVEIARNKLLSLEKCLLEKSPQLPHILRDVHEYMKVAPECVTIFKDEPEMCATLVKALERQTNIELVSPSKKAPSAAKTKALGKASATDLGF